MFLSRGLAVACGAFDRQSKQGHTTAFPDQRERDLSLLLENYARNRHIFPDCKNVSASLVRRLA
ncbi:hypothetical protein I7I50_09888 [Histoplasma capsulatum G186AR]|nr:hypothetical protein I7I52_01126 [Histoplasma capsulatum]QSS68800.1 hypothetical protein I7I50_09888 [Histoplasma capsulatum G186AR]